jgi:hypothetical protein
MLSPMVGVWLGKSSIRLLLLGLVVFGIFAPLPAAVP